MYPPGRMTGPPLTDHGVASTDNSWNAVFSPMGVTGGTTQTIQRKEPRDAPAGARREAAIKEGS